MRDLIIDMADFGGVASAGDEVVLSAPAVRGSSVDPGRLITPQPRALELVDGVVTVPVEVGPLRVTLKPQGSVLPGTTFKTVVPEGEGPITLRECLENQFRYDPPVVNRGLDLIEGARDEALGQVAGAVAAEIGDFRSGLVPPTVVNLWDYDATTAHTLNILGTPLDHETHRLSPFIPVDRGEKYIGRAGEATGRFFRALFFDSSYALIPGQDTSWTEQGETRHLVAPDTARWVRIVTNPGQPPHVLMIFNRGDTLWTPDANNDSGWWDDRELPPNPLAGELDIVTGNRLLQEVPPKLPTNLWDDSAKTIGLLSTIGNVLESENNWVSHYIPVTPGRPYQSMVLSVNEIGAPVWSELRIVWFHADYSYIPGTDTNLYEDHMSWVAPADARFVRVGVARGGGQTTTVIFNEGQTLLDLNNPGAPTGYWDERESPEIPRSKPGGVAGLDLGGNVVNAAGDRVLTKVESDERYATIGSGGGMPAHLRPDPATPAFTVGPATDEVTGLVRYPAGELSPDGTLMLSGRGSTGLFRSFDDGGTWESVHAFPYSIHGVRFLGNGEVLVSTISSVDPGELWVSDGWAVNNLTAVWTKVLTTPYGQNHINGLWGMSVWRNFVFVSEYGSDDETDAARHAWLSTDYGKTFEVVFDLLDMYPAEDRDGLHVHGCAIDPYEPGGRPRLWVAHGDTIDGVFYSDDLGDTWLPVEWDGPKVQQVGIHAMPNGVLFTSDASPQGIYRVPRSTNKFATPRAELAHQILPEDSSLTVLGTGHYQSPREGAPLLLPFGVVSFTNNPRAAMLLATVDGEHFYELWRDDVAPTSLSEVVGPTASGKLVGVINDSSRHGTPRSKLVIDAPEWVPVSTGL